MVDVGWEGSAFQAFTDDYTLAVNIIKEPPGYRNGYVRYAAEAGRFFVWRVM